MREEVIGPKSKITVATGVVLVSAALTCAGMFTSIKYDMSAMRRHMATDWTLRDMILWAAKLSDSNRTNLVVPEPENVWRKFQDTP